MPTAKRKKRSFVYQCWVNYFKEHHLLTRGSWRTMGHALADFILKDAPESKRYKRLEVLAQALNRQRSYAILYMRENGITVFTCGENGRVEVMSTNKIDAEEHNARQIRRGQNSVLSVERNLFDMDNKKRLESGWFSARSIKTMQKLLPPGKKSRD